MALSMLFTLLVVVSRSSQVLAMIVLLKFGTPAVRELSMISSQSDLFLDEC